MLCFHQRIFGAVRTSRAWAGILRSHAYSIALYRAHSDWGIASTSIAFSTVS